MTLPDVVTLQNTLYASKNPTRRWLHCARRDWILDALHRTQKEKTGTALEVGPGSGVYLPALASLYGRVVACDIEDAFLENAKPVANTLGNIQLVRDDITHSAFQDGAFDMILCTEVIEHIKDSQKALSEMRRILKPGGVLILSTPQRYSPLEVAAKIAFLPGIIQLVRLIYGEAILETGHINLLTELDVRRQLGHAGFRLQETHKSGMYFPLVAEFLGNRGLKFEQWLEEKIRNTPWDWMLWTQYHIATA